ncbi:MAG: TIGR04282 family arsenosugar biosynthesis glycosyltransferase [Solirubrobacteraceae bacterium]
MSTLAVICKAPVPGAVKTRLCPPWTLEQAAAIATGALRDTFDAVRATSCSRRVAVLDGAPGPWLGSGVDAIAQEGNGLGERLAAAFASLGAPTLLIGMDTPQVTPALLHAALRATVEHGSALGLTVDGGYWAIGLGRTDPEVFEGVPMSTRETGARQLERLRDRGFTPAMLPTLVDADDHMSARAVARCSPGTSFAQALDALAVAP